MTPTFRASSKGPAIALATCVVLVGAAVMTTRAGPDDAGRPTEPSCERLRGQPERRLRLCLDDLPQVPLSQAAVTTVDDVLTAGAAKLLVAGAPLKVRGDQVALVDDPDLQEILLEDGEEDAARILRERGFGGITVDRLLTRALDRDDAVLARLANHDFLEWFQLRRATPEVLLYSLRSSPMRLTDEAGAGLVAGLRSRLAGTTPVAQQWRPSSVRLIGGLRLQGQTLVMRHATGEDVERVLDDLAVRMTTRWERDVETKGVGRLREKLPQVRLDVHVVLERAEVETRDRRQLADLWQMGIDGAMVTMTSAGGEEVFGYLPGSEATPMGLRDADEFLRATAKAHSLPGERPWELDRTRLTLVRDQHFMEREPGGGEVVRMMRGVPVVSMDELTDENIRQMLIDGGEWWLRNQLPDNSFVYKYWPDQNRFSGDYNEVRHILAARDLADTWRHRPDPRYLDGARRAMDWLVQFEVRDTDPPADGLPQPPPDSLLFRYPSERIGEKLPNQKLGTVVVALLGWIRWAEETGSRDEDDRIRRMATYALSQALPDGRFNPYNVPKTHPYHGQVNDIVPGEAALALGMVAEYFAESQWVDFFPRFLDYYEVWFRERASKKEPYGRWPHGTYTNSRRLELVQFGPWAVMAAKQYYDLTGDRRAAEFGLEVADWIIDNYQWSEDRSPWPDFVGGYYKATWELPAMQSFVYSEGTAAAYAIAIRFRPEAKGKYELATRQSLRFLRVMQYDDVDAYFAARPELVHGGVKYAMNQSKIRTDYVGHAMSTLAQYLEARAADPDVAG